MYDKRSNKGDRYQNKTQRQDTLEEMKIDATTAKNQEISNKIVHNEEEESVDIMKIQKVLEHGNKEK